ncbi:MAG: alpha-1 4-glucan-protein synthase [Halobacteriaceae archaeon]
MAADICVIVPTIRNPAVVRDYLDNARQNGFPVDRLHVLLVTEADRDTAAMAELLEDEGVAGTVVDGPAREAWLEDHDVGEYAHLIPAASHAQTSFGLLYLWANGFEYGVFIDDDTAPHPDSDFFGTHLRNLEHDGQLTVARSDERWVNVLYQRDGDLYPRGYPYAAMDAQVETHTDEIDSVVLSQGLWTNVPDLDAVRILNDGDLDGQARTRTTAGDFGDPFVVDRHQYLTISSMNVAFKREIVPAFYQLPMDDNPWGVGRFDDIWSGVILKRIADHLGDAILTGPPLCQHNKAPRSTFDDLAAEAPGLELNEHLWEVVDDVDPAADSYADGCHAIGTALANGDFDRWRNGAFFNHIGEYMQDWLACLEAIRPTTPRQPQDARP